MSFDLSLSPTAQSFIIQKALTPLNEEGDGDFSVIKDARACTTHKAVLRFLSTIPPECTEYKNLRFHVVKREDESGQVIERCSVAQLQEIVLFYLQMEKEKKNVKEEKEISILKRKKLPLFADHISCKNEQKEWNVEISVQALKYKKELIVLLESVEGLIEELKEKGPILSHRSHFGALHKQPQIPAHSFHCHLTDGLPTYVACWSVDKQKGQINLFYIGTHEQAPYVK